MTRQGQSLPQLIQGLGFTEIEAEIYSYLLQSTPATGYRVAKSIGRAFTNTYKALEGLRAKGAVLVEEGGSKLARAVPIEELLDQFETRFREQRRLTIEAVRQLPRQPSDHRIYHLGSVEQVYERCRQMLSESRERVLLEVFPEPCQTLRCEIEACAGRGVKTAARVYAGEQLRGVRVIHSPFGEESLSRWRAQWLALFVDGRQVLLANLANGGDGVYEAVWSANLMLARSFFSHMNSDLHHYAFAEYLRSTASIEEARAAYDELEKEFPPGGDLGHRDLLAQFGMEVE